MLWSTLAAFLLLGPVQTTADNPPRKVVVGTVLQRFWGAYPGLEKRLDQLTEIIDKLGAEAQRKYGRGLDLAILPEVAVTGELSGPPLERSLPFAGPVADAFAKAARRNRCYIVAPMYLREGQAVTNVGILVGRDGRELGTYRKLHPAVASGSDVLEGGIQPGKEAPVFDCDFGKLGIQICFDMNFEYGWKELARKGAQIVAWPTQSPQTARPRIRAAQGRFYVVSSNWRHNATIFEPTGHLTAQIREPEQILVQEIDLSYALLPWSRRLQNGAALRKRFGDRVGFRYYEDEDLGIFWSNDPKMPIGQMIRSLGLVELEQEMPRVQELFRKAGVPAN